MRDVWLSLTGNWQLETGNSQLVVGTRGSLLARSQTQWVVDRLIAANPGLSVRTQIITTAGDRDQTRPLPEIGAKGLFTLDLEQALLAGEIDLAVHSAKDLPTVLTPGLDLVGYPTREDPRDAWVSTVPFDQLPPDSVVGTSSLRRQAQLLMRRPDLKFIALRGNVDTRIKKIHRGDCAGAVLAMAGLKRSGLAEHVTHPFEPDAMLPAPGQGALALEGRANDEGVRAIVAGVSDAATAAEVTCERAVLAALDAGCRAPVAILARCSGAAIRCEALVSDPTGRQALRAAMDGSADEVSALARRMITDLLGRGAAEIVGQSRASLPPELGSA
jgi:hydroxymethylbilane synthase